MLSRLVFNSFNLSDPPVSVLSSGSMCAYHWASYTLLRQTFLCSPGWPRTCNPLALSSQGLGL
jgi:hypothetical protein